MKQILYLFLPLFFLLPTLFPHFVFAESPPDLQITEASFNSLPGDAQWIELYNASLTNIDLSHWQLENSEGETTLLEGILLPGAYTILYWEDTYFDQTDSIVLTNNTSSHTWFIETIMPPGQSVDFVNDVTVLTLFPTPGRPNLVREQIVCEQESTDSSSANKTNNTEEETNSGSTLETGDILISELHANPEGDETSGEFIELYNPTSFEINLDEWTIADTTKTFTLNEVSITSEGFLVLTRTETSIALNNTSETITLTDPFGSVINTFSYATTEEGLSWNAGASNYLAEPSMGAENNIPVEQAVTEESAIDETLNEPETIEEKIAQEEEEISITLDPLLSDIRLSELLPNPIGSDTEEWIELVNPTDSNVTLTGLILTDGSSEYVFDDIVIASLGYYQLKRIDSGIALNNTNETISLKIEETITDSFVYEFSDEGIAWAKIDGEWIQTEELTPGEENQASLIEEISEDYAVTATTTSKTTNAKTSNKSKSEKLYKQISLKDWNTVEDGDLVELTGIITALPGLFQKRILIIQDPVEPIALEIYFHQAEWPALTQFDLLTIKGEKSLTKTANRLLVKATENLTVSGNKVIEPTPFAKATQNVFTSVEGGFIEQSKNELLLDVNGDEVIINLKKAGISLSEVLPEQRITVTGLKDETSVQIIPRSREDIVVQTIESRLNEVETSMIANVDEQPPTTGWYIASAIGLTTLAGFGLARIPQVRELVGRKFGVG